MYSYIRLKLKGIGKLGEIYAKNVLRERGLIVLRENFVTGKFETDIIALDEFNDLVFVEVKTSIMRNNISHETQLFEIHARSDQSKQNRVRLSADRYVSSLLNKPRCVHFITVSILIGKDGKLIDYRFDDFD